MFRFLTGCAALLAVCLSAAAQEPADARDDAPRPTQTPASTNINCESGAAGCEPREFRAAGFEFRVEGRPLSDLDEARDEAPFARPPAPRFAEDTEDDAPKPAAPDLGQEGFNWKAALEQSALLLAVQHGYALTQPKTRRELRGPFFRDYFQSLGSLHGWADGGRFFTNYVAHPLQGAATGFIQVQNDPKGIRQQFGGSRAYWRSRLKALGWAAISSTQFEIGPVSQASLGNVGKARKLTYVDLVVTPTVGTGLLVGEDALDRYLLRRIESSTDNFYVRIAARMLLNPARSCANLLRFRKPWHRDTR